MRKGRKKGNKKKKKKMKKSKKNEEKKTKERRGKIRAWRRKKRKRKRKRLRFLVFRRSKVVSPRIKVGLRDKGYAWVPKFEFFVEVPKCMNLSYIGYLLPSGHVRVILVQL